MDWYEPEVRALEQQQRAGRFPMHSPVFYGSSSFRLWDTLAEDVDPAIVNLAFGGSTLEACAHFFSRVVAPVQPASLLVYAGDNDLGDGHSPEAVLRSFRALAAQADRLPSLRSFGFLSIKPSPARWALADRIRQANRSIADEIARRPGAWFVDVYPAMLNAQGRPDPALFQADGLHLSRAGYQLWARLLEPYRNRIVVQNSQPRNLDPVVLNQSEP